MYRRVFSHPVRWLLLIWLCLIYVWGLSFLWTPSKGPCAGLPQLLLIHCLPDVSAVKDATVKDVASQAQTGVSLLWIGGFTALIALQGVLLWVSLSQRLPRRWHWLLLLQGLLALAFCLLVPEAEIALSLFLLLMVGAIDFLKQTRLGIIAATGYIVLYVVSITLTQVLPSAGTVKWQSLWTAADFWIGHLNTLAPLFLLLVAYLLLYVQHLRAHTELEGAYGHLKESATRIEALTRLTERQRLARTLHDTLAQDLVGLIRQLEVADAHQTRQHYQRAQEIIQQTTSRARSALTEARSAIAELREEPLSASDLASAVQEEISRFTQTTSITCKTALDGLVNLSAPRREPALRLIAEGLSNVARHAQAQHAWVRVKRAEGVTIIEVCDDGLGFEPSAAVRQAGHYGLLGLQERARLGGGSLEIRSARGEGTTLRLRLPEHTKGDVE